MNHVAFFLHLSLFLNVLSALPAFGTEFQRIDLERLMRNHPLMKQFDPATRRFLKTPLQTRSVEQLESDLLETEKRIEETETRKASFVATSLMKGGNTEASWHGLRAFDDELGLLRNRKAEIAALLAAGGIPSLKSLSDTVREIIANLLSTQRTGSGTVLLNTFPRFPSAPRFLPEQGLQEMFQSHDPEILRRYLAFSCSTALLFRATAEPILYSQGERQK